MLLACERIISYSEWCLWSESSHMLISGALLESIIFKIELRSREIINLLTCKKTQYFLINPKTASIKNQVLFHISS